MSVRWLLIVAVATGCGAEPPAPAPDAASMSAEPVIVAEIEPSVSLTDGLELAGQIEKVLDAIFETEWQPALDSESAAANDKSRAALVTRLKQLDALMADIIIALQSQRLLDSRLRDESEQESLLLRQQIIAEEAKVKSADKLLIELHDAIKEVIAENNKGGSYNGLREKANAEALEKERENQKSVAAIRLGLEKKKRMLKLYE